MAYTANPAIAAQDVVAIVRGMIAAAGLVGEVDQAALQKRVARAVLGYMETL